jgi:trk system potassium uptake protein
MLGAGSPLCGIRPEPGLHENRSRGAIRSDGVPVTLARFVHRQSLERCHRRLSDRNGAPAHEDRSPRGTVGSGASFTCGDEPCSTLRMHVVVVGCGRVGAGLGRLLTREGHSVAIIDRNPRAFRRLPDDWHGQRVSGSGFDRDDLERAGATRADALAAVTNGDNTNILTVRIARETYGIDRVVARIYDPRRAEIYQRLGIPTVATVTWTIDQVRRRLLSTQVTREWSDASGKLLVVERSMPDGWAGRRLDELAIPGRVSLVAVTRAGSPRLDAEDLIGQEGDVLHLAVLADAVEELEHRLAHLPALGGKGMRR